MDDSYIDDAYDAMIECALWSSIVSNEAGDVIVNADDVFGPEDIDDDILAELQMDIRAFIEDNADDLEGMRPSQVGHDFWLTREGHGTGFWDRGLGDVGDRLTKAAKVYGSLDLGLYLTNEQAEEYR